MVARKPKQKTTYRVRAQYTVEVELTVEGPPDTDMSDPNNWGEIVLDSETECDRWLDDVKSFEEIEED